MKKIITKLNYVKLLKDLDETKFEKALKKIEIIGKDRISILKLNYIITKKGVTLSRTNSLFHLDENELKKLIKKTHKVIKIKNKEHYTSVLRSLWNSGYKVIPLDNLLYVNLTENFELEYEHSIFISSQDIT